MSNIDRLIVSLKSGELLLERDIKIICTTVTAIFTSENNLVKISSPVTVCGDIHGQFPDLLKLFDQGGDCPFTSYVFMGDLVDRGQYSLETILLLFLLKIRYPSRITLIRGNHESRKITQIYGFYDECINKYSGGNIIWKYCVDVFDYMPLAALIDGKTLCVHGGLSPNIQTIDQINHIFRVRDVPDEGNMCDLLWSDPDDVSEWTLSPRGCGYIFGADIVKEFNYVNNLDLICRSHQLVMDGYKYYFDESLVTVWSAPNYCGRCGNAASILKLSSTDRTFILFREFVDELSDDEYVPPGAVSYPNHHQVWSTNITINRPPNHMQAGFPDYFL